MNSGSSKAWMKKKVGKTICLCKFCKNKLKFVPYINCGMDHGIKSNEEKEVRDCGLSHLTLLK